MITLLGFLAGRLDRVHFVRSLDQARVAARLSTRPGTLWPHRSFEGFVDGVPVPSPFLFIAALVERDDDIFVNLDFPGAGEAPWYQTVLADAPQDLAAANPEERMEELRQRIDHTLDVYAECQRLLQNGAGEREQELSFFLNLARMEMQALSRELNSLRQELDQQGRARGL
ncbi:MAG: hypothetical protein IRY95_08185 [Clostridia bacterium]|nr:hypothetical protein [Clostridia bacterium]